MPLLDLASGGPSPQAAAFWEENKAPLSLYTVCLDTTGPSGIPDSKDSDSERHSLSCRERAHASDFTAALSDYQQYLRRSEEAAAMQQAFAKAEAGHHGPNLPTLDFSLKPGETVSLKLAAKVQL